MKRLMLIIAAFAALTACHKVAEPIAKQSPSETTEVSTRPGDKLVPKTLHATFEQNPLMVDQAPQTKAGFTYDATQKTYSHYWEAGDKIAVYPYDNLVNEYTVSDVANGTFNLSHKASGTASNTYDYIYAVYPYDAVDFVDIDNYDSGLIDADGRMTVTTFINPRYSEPYGYGNVMVARTQDSELQFKNLVGWIKIRLLGDITINSLTLFGNNYSDVVSGTVYVSFDGQGNPVVSPGEYDTYNYSNIDFVGAAQEPVRLSPYTPTDFYFPVLPGTLEDGFYVDGSTNIGEIYFETTKSITVERNKVTQMAVKNYFGPSATLKPGSQFNAAIKTLVSGSTAYAYTNNSSITSIVLDTDSAVTTGLDVSATGSEKPVYANFDSGTGVLTLSSKATTIYANADASSMFKRFLGLTSTPAVGLNTSNVTDMSEMFYECTGLTSLDLSGYDTSNVTNMASMFNGSAISSLDISNLNTALVTNMSEMFMRCSGLTSLDLSGFNTSAVTNMNGMFYNCTNLTSIDMTGWDTSLVQNMGSMFYNCGRLTSLDVSGFNTSAVKNMGSMFYYCNRVSTIDVSNFNTSNVTDMSYMFYYCTDLTGIIVHSFDLAKVTTTNSMFYNCRNITGAINFISIANNAPLLADMSYMFLGCSAVSKIYLPGTTTALTNVKAMFSGCSNLTIIYNTVNFKGRPTDVSAMFKGCSSLTGITLETGFNTTDCNHYESLFSGCSSLHNVYFYGLVVKGSGSPGLGGGTDFYAKFNNAFAGCGCRVHCVGYSSELNNTNPYNAFGTTHSSYTEGTRPTFHESTTHSTAYTAGHVYFCTGHSDLVSQLK